MARRLVLVGGGHAHLEVLHALRARPLADVDVTLISPEPFAAYTGMVPGMLAGEHQPGTLSFDLRALCRAAGVRYVEEAVESVDGAQREAYTAHHTYTFDACSMNVGSAPAGATVPGMPTYALPLRPLSNALMLRDRFDRLLQEGTPPAPPSAGSPGRLARGVRVVVVGGGAAGVEVAIALALRGGARAQVTLVHEGAALLAGGPARAGALAARACRRAGIAVQLSSRVARVLPDGVVLAGGTHLASALTVWLAGAAPPRLLADSLVPRTADGFLAVDDTLRATDGTPVWGAGDCAVMAQHGWVPRAGVYAVRQGGVLAHNLRVALEGAGAARRYVPQRHFLSLLISGEGRALLAWRTLAIEARWARALKRRIDLRFMRRHSLPGSDAADA